MLFGVALGFGGWESSCEHATNTILHRDPISNKSSIKHKVTLSPTCALQWEQTIATWSPGNFKELA